MPDGVGALVIAPISRYGASAVESKPRLAMKVEAGEAVEAGRSHLIKRPRLTRLLDGVEARIILLVAPAGYGKTTLAREWLANRPHGWYRGSPASADVAAFALGLARAASSIVPAAGERLTTRLRVSSGPGESEGLAEMLAEDLVAWPQDAWLVVDDYHFACDSELSERFVERLAEACPVRLLIASRSRPSWATARRLLYGELYEVGRNLLAMNQDEAQTALAQMASKEREGLIALADGWPALLGLAAVAETLGTPGSPMPHDLYTHFLDELYRALAPRLQKELRLLALAPSVTVDIACAVIKARGLAAVREIVEMGLLQASARDRYEFHPLLRGFLVSQFVPDEDDSQGHVVRELVRMLIGRAEWDNAFEVIQSNFDTEVFEELLEAALPRMVDEARLPTLIDWISAGLAQGFDSPLLDLAESEVALKSGDLRRAEATAERAWTRLPPGSPRASKALSLAGTAAHLAWRDQDALMYFQRAERAAVSETDALPALWGQFLASDTLELEADASSILGDFIARSGDSLDEKLRIATGHFLTALLSGCILPTLDANAPLISIAHRCRDPLILGAFLNTYLGLLALAGRYEEAVEVTRNQLELASTYSLRFVVPLAHMHMAEATWGLRDFRACRASVANSARAVEGLTSGELVLTCLGILRAKGFLASQAPNKAVTALDHSYPIAMRCPIHSEHLAWWSLVYACAGEQRRARGLANRADGMSSRLEVAGVTPWTRALLGSRDAVCEAFRAMKKSGHIDAFVATYRARPKILQTLAQDESLHDELRVILEAARDFRLAESVGLRIQTSDERPLLTKREREVIELVSQGMTNKEIGRALFIEETTVKVHVRKVCRKLGVRSRTEAAMRVAEMAG